MSGLFSVVHLLSGKNPFTPQLPAAAQEARVKKRLILNDYSIPYCVGKELICILETLWLLLEKEFEIIVCKEGSACERLSLTSEKNLLGQLEGFKPILKEEIQQYDTQFSDDTAVIIDFIKMRELLSCVKNYHFQPDIERDLDCLESGKTLINVIFPFLINHENNPKAIDILLQSLPELLMSVHAVQVLTIMLQRHENFRVIFSQYSANFKFVFLNVNALECFVKCEELQDVTVKGIKFYDSGELETLLRLANENESYRQIVQTIDKIWLDCNSGVNQYRLKKQFPNLSQYIYLPDPDELDEDEMDEAESESESESESDGEDDIHVMTQNEKSINNNKWSVIINSHMPEDQLLTSIPKYHPVEFNGDGREFRQYLSAKDHVEPLCVTIDLKNDTSWTGCSEKTRSLSLIGRRLMGMEEIDELSLVFPLLNQISFVYRDDFFVECTRNVISFLHYLENNLDQRSIRYPSLLNSLLNELLNLQSNYPRLSSQQKDGSLDLCLEVDSCVENAIENYRGEDSVADQPAQEDMIYDDVNAGTDEISFEIEEDEDDDSDENSHSPFQMRPVCKVLNPALKNMQIRRKTFRIAYSQDQGSYIKVPITPEWSDSLPSDNGLVATHEMTDSLSQFFWHAPSQLWCRQLPGLSQHDIILTASISINKGQFTLRYSKSDRFYYMTSVNKPDKGVVFQYQIYVPSLNLNRIQEVLATPFRKIYCEDDREDAERNIEDVINHPEYYDCEQRVVGFLSRYQESHGFVGVNSGTHAWVENEQGLLDLGGQPYPEVYCEGQLPHHQPGFKPFVLPEMIKPLHTEEEFLDKIKAVSANTMFVFDSAEELEAARVSIINLKKISILVIDTPDDLKIPEQSIRVEGMQGQVTGREAGWLFQHLQKKSFDTLLIDWTNFSARQIPQHNTCIGKLENRNISGLALPHSCHVIGLALKNSPALSDRSHVSRHLGKVYRVSGSAIPKPQRPSVSFQGALEIDLYESSHWFEMLMGYVKMLDGKLSHEPGKLLSAQTDQIIIKNPPVNNQAFQRFVHHLRFGTLFKYYDQLKCFKKPFQVGFVRGYDFSRYHACIKKIQMNVTDEELERLHIDQVITPSTFDYVLHDAVVTENHLLHQKKGWLELGYRSFFITRTLGYHQLCSMLDKLKTLSEPITLYCAPGVILPDSLRGLASRSATSYQQHAQPIEKNRDFFDLEINVTGRKVDHLLFNRKATLNRDKILCDENESDLLRALRQGKKILLTGVFSSEMCDYLSTLLLPNPYLWHKSKKEWLQGQIYLAPSQSLDCLWIQRPGVFVRSSLHQRPVIQDEVVDESKRIPALLEILNREPAVFITGQPGIGKSHFIRELMDDQRFNVYSENRLKEFLISDESSAMPVIVFDEAEKRETDWTVFEGIYHKTPHLLIEDRIYPLPPQAKFIFLANDSPKIPTLFHRMAKLRFHPLSQQTIVNRILQPIIGDKTGAELFYQAHAHLPLRVLQAQAIQAKIQNNNNLSHPAPQSLLGFELTPSRRSLVNQLVECLQQRAFQCQASQDAARYGGQSGLWLEGPPGIGKTDCVQATLETLSYREGIDYVILSASLSVEELITRLHSAFQKGQIAVIDELDTAITPTLVAHLNAFLMGEDLDFRRPEKPGFKLIGTGNGPLYPERSQLPPSLLSRLKHVVLGEYPEAEARQILYKLFSAQIQLDPSFLSLIESHLAYYVRYARHFSFRELCDWLKLGGNPDIPLLPKLILAQAPSGSSSATSAPTAFAYTTEFDDLALQLGKDLEQGFVDAFFADDLDQTDLNFKILPQ